MPGVWETEAEWQRLKRELDGWRDRRDRADRLWQHRSQLDAAYTLVERVLAERRPHGLVPGALRRNVDAPFLRRALDQLPLAASRARASAHGARPTGRSGAARPSRTATPC